MIMKKQGNKSLERWNRSADALKKNLQRRKARRKNKELDEGLQLKGTNVPSTKKMEMIE